MCTIPIIMDEENDQQILDGIDEDIFKVDYELGSFESLNYILDKVESELSKYHHILIWAFIWM